MPIDPGLGGWAAPVPVDPILIQHRPYIPPVSSGQPGQIIPAPVPLVPSVSYSSVARVVQAYRDNIISYNQAYDILVSQFGFSGLDATDALGVEMEETIAYQDLTPPEKPDVLVSEPEITDTGKPQPVHMIPFINQPLFDNFELIGLLAVIGAVYLFKKQG